MINTSIMAMQGKSSSWRMLKHTLHITIKVAAWSQTFFWHLIRELHDLPENLSSSLKILCNELNGAAVIWPPCRPDSLIWSAEQASFPIHFWPFVYSSLFRTLKWILESTETCKLLNLRFSWNLMSLNEDYLVLVSKETIDFVTLHNEWWFFLGRYNHFHAAFILIML
jgi:hypothetical protein